ncbi:sugar transporter ERD6-like 16 isoform X5 [Hibiscus syriacus]|uniref:sugar transporter ERD6-like 16 isoform X5 n=1 Tax=Hibiscus syriacus TaxID=106335 RepID=UPI0019215636|nr:sugar transporter ERD6-like 16 isoform X5 [Hibiscus syriacus]
MTIGQFKDVESGEIKGLEDLETPLIVVVEEDEKVVVVGVHGNGKSVGDENGSIWMVLLCTFVAVCGSFEFGSCFKLFFWQVGYSAPTQSAIREDLNLSLAEFSMFGSILTIAAMLGAVTSGRIADMIGRKGAMRLSAGFCITGWLAVYFSKGALSLDAGRFSTGYGIGVFSYVVKKIS